MFSSNTETRITATYQDGDGTIDLVVDDMTTDTNTNQLTTFTLTGDSGSNQTIAHGNTLDIAGGDGIATVVGSTDTVTVGLDIDGMTDIGAALVDADLMIVDDGAGGTNRKATMSRLKTYMQNNLTFTTDTNQQTTFTLTGDSGSNQTIAHGNTLDIAGGDGIATVVGATDTVTVGLDIDGMTDIGEALVDADLMIVDNGAGGTNRKATMSRLKTYMQNNLTFTTNTNTQLSNEQVQDIAGGMFSSNTETLITATYQDGDGTIDLVVDNDLSNYDNSSSGFITATLTTEQVQDIVGAMFSSNTETRISATYQDGDGTIDLVADDMNFSVSDITGATALTSGLASTDELVLSDAGTLKRMDVSVLQAYMQSNLSLGIGDVVDDTSPQLGGNLDVNGNEIVSTSNADIGITPNGSGKVVIGSTTSQHDGLSKLTIKGSDAGMLIEKHDDGSSGGPTLALYRYSASVADSDLIGQINFRGEGSTGNPSTYIGLRTEIEDTTEGTKDGKLIVRGLKNNTQTEFLSFGSTGVKINDSYTFPTSDGSNGQVLQTNGSGTLSFASAGGASALDDLSDAITTATSNVGIGSGALDSLSASNGNYNVALGINAGTAITTGDRNISIGYGAGDGYDTESDNVAIGYDALGGSIAGAEKNVAIGNYTGDALTTGDENTLIGHQSGTTLTTAKYSVAVGYRSLYNTDTGDRNTAVGYLSMEGAANNSADQNAAFGGYSLKNVQDGATGNTGLGYLSLSAVTTGDKNIAIGYESGDNITTGSNNVVIGAADVDTATGDDQISISGSDGGVTWLKGDSNGIKALKIKVKPVSSNTTLTDAQSGSYVYWTAGTLTLPATAESGQQYTIINNTGGSATPSLGTSNAIASGWTSHAAMADETARTYVSVATNKWIYIG